MVAILVADDQGNYLSANSAACNLFGYSLNEMLNMNIRDLKTVVKPGAEERYREYIQKGEEKGEFDFNTKAGDRKFAFYHAVRVKDNFNLSMLVDITKQKETEIELLKAKEIAIASEQRFKSIIENAPDGVVIIDEHGKFVYGSPNAARLFGYNENEVIGHSGNEFTHPDDLPAVFKTLETIINDPLQKPTIGYRFKRKNGEYRWIETTFTNLLADKAINGIVLNFTDITERKQILEDLVIAKEKAEESDRLKTAFLQNMSHEIRTPMNAIMGFSELLLQNFENKEKIEKFVSIINQRCSDLLVIINDILDIAKIESGQLQLSEESANIIELLQELEIVFNEQKLKFNKSDISIVLHNPYHSSDLYLITDRSRLMQIFTNLISNALKFTYQGKIEFGFSFNNEQQIEFYVSDSGIGIPKDKHEIIFERFIQLNQGASTYSGGNGLGLAITKGLVKMLGGSIWLQSETEKGTTFYFTIKTVIESDFGSLINNKTDYIINDSFKDKTVLVVEDDKYNLALIKEILENQGFNLICTEKGEEAVHICLTSPIDLVLMDIGLPDISGYEAIRQILSKKSKVKIIAQTAYAGTTDKHKAIQSGCIDYISKPLKSKGLIEIVKKYV
ncbi:MAG: PAS domain S-box protein [Bacteroidales bacterium]|nr:PAS domain S-box protein [Bacteroidales bacterium]